MQSLTENQINELQTLFNKMCRNTETTLGHREVSQMLSGIGIKATAQELKDIISDVIGEDRQRVDFDAFIVLMTRFYRQLSLSEEIDSLFNTIDISHDNIIDSQDIVNIMKSQGVVVTADEAQALLSLIGDNPQKGLTKEELTKFVQTKL